MRSVAIGSTMNSAPMGMIAGRHNVDDSLPITTIAAADRAPEETTTNIIGLSVPNAWAPASPINNTSAAPRTGGDSVVGPHSLVDGRAATPATNHTVPASTSRIGRATWE